YCVLKVLGQGEVGITYVTWRQGSTMVLKTLTPRWADNPRAWAALECEAGMLQQIQHSQIPRFIDFFSIGDQPYLAMEFFPGQSLAQRLVTGQAVALEQAIAWVSNLCEVLHYLHGFVPPLLHRGIKPSSLIPQPLPDRPNAMALVDFGTIKAIVLGERASSIGFAGYSAPEQLAVDATPAVDLYGLGALLAHLVTGQNPLAFYSDRGSGYRFYSDAVPGISPELANLLHTLTHPNPEQRYRSAEAVRVALQQLAISS
ncbi:MAG: serine/threonine protein kinase, partial [Leptolyngbyaceae cyanobacterium SL_7_1]|nr:serine/threonine protein kinase [Leptolyngbyaceae cyanobacterium SL_7_1]